MFELFSFPGIIVAYSDLFHIDAYNQIVVFPEFGKLLVILGQNLMYFHDIFSALELQLNGMNVFIKSNRIFGINDYSQIFLQLSSFLCIDVSYSQDELFLEVFLTNLLLFV